MFSFISIHALLAESDWKRFPPMCTIRHFYPRSPCGERRQQPAGTTSTTYFYPRSPCGERRNKKVKYTSTGLFLSTLSLRRATLYRPPPLTSRTISIHALLAESDLACRGWFEVIYYFYPRSPCGERPAVSAALQLIPLISIHALLAESDAPQGCYTLWEVLFLSTLSLRRATGCQRPCGRPTTYFYPRSPCGERRSNQPATMRTWRFLSTLSLRRATQSLPY